ncbi:MAG: ABC transporter ATP-binding protein [Gammaproteobacteria bacterium]|nr:ABC transporter ATP-binding protein [Gammaproteobacteria bacterium]
MSSAQHSHSTYIGRGVSVSIANLTRRFGDRAVLRELSLSVGPGEFVAVLGPSGCGKSTLLRLIAGLDEPDAGRVAIDDNPWPIAYVFQDPCLMPWRTVLQNVALPLELTGVPRAARHRAAARLLATVGLADAAERFPGQLSGGMRMRVSLARALITEPRLLLLDEPFAALDALTRQHLDNHLQDLFLEHRMTVLFVTHSISEAVFLADRVIVMSGAGGSLPADRRIELDRPRRDGVQTTVEFAREAGNLSRLLTEGSHTAL